jgi:DNA-binding CsgD family transcriptional regulator
MALQLVEEFATELAGVDSGSELAGSLDRIADALGFDHFALALEARTGEDLDPSGVLLHDYPEEWAKVYVTFDLAGRDPVRRACDKSFVGFAWESIGKLVPLTRGDRQMLAVGRECGIGDGYTVPRHLPGLARGSCTFVVRLERQLPRKMLCVAEAIGALALACALRLSAMVRPAPAPRLSDRQRECLLWVARGKTAAETAMILGISPETVVQHLKMARERYEVHCSQSLVLSALFDGLIGFGDVFCWRDDHRSGRHRIV